MRRIERDEGINLDEEFEKDGLDSLLSRFRYRAEDARAGRPNPTKIDIDPEKLARDIAFYRSAINSSRRFRAGEPETEALEAAETIAAEEEVARTFGLERDLQSALRSTPKTMVARRSKPTVRRPGPRSSRRVPRSGKCVSRMQAASMRSI